MPTTLASKERVARHLRERAVARSAARGRRAPALDPPVRGPPVLGTPVLGPPLSGASLAGVLNAGVLRLAPRPPVVVTPLPRSHGDRSCRPRRYAAANPPSSRVPLSLLQGEVPLSPTRHRRARAKPTTCLRPTPTQPAVPTRKKGGKNDQTKASDAPPRCLAQVWGCGSSPPAPGSGRGGRILPAAGTAGPAGPLFSSSSNARTIFSPRISPCTSSPLIVSYSMSAWVIASSLSRLADKTSRAFLSPSVTMRRISSSMTLAVSSDMFCRCVMACPRNTSCWFSL